MSPTFQNEIIHGTQRHSRKNKIIRKWTFFCKMWQN